MKSHATQRVGRNTSSAEEAGSHRKGERRKRGSCSCTEGPGSHHPRVLTAKGRRPPASVHVALVLPADPLVLAPVLLPRPKPRPARGHNCPATGSLGSGPCHCTQGLLPRQPLCPELAQPITGAKQSFSRLIFKST